MALAFVLIALVLIVLGGLLTAIDSAFSSTRTMATSASGWTFIEAIA